MECPKLNITNGHVMSTDVTYGSEVTIACIEGYQIRGNPTFITTCNVTNNTTQFTPVQWSGSHEKCHCEYV